MLVAMDQLTILDAEELFANFMQSTKVRVYSQVTPFHAIMRSVMAKQRVQCANKTAFFQDSAVSLLVACYCVESHVLLEREDSEALLEISKPRIDEKSNFNQLV